MRAISILAFAAASVLGQVDTDPACIAFNSTYQSAVAACDVARTGKKDDDGLPVDITSQLAYCAIPECKAAIAASATRKALVATNKACMRMEVTALPSLYCTDSCVTQKKAYENNDKKRCGEANSTNLLSYCQSCVTMFDAHLKFNQNCGVNSATDNAYITHDLSDFASQITYCKTTFPKGGLVFPDDPNVLPPEPSKTSTYIGIAAGAVVLILIVVGVLMYRRRQQQRGKPATGTNTSGNRYYSNRTPHSGQGNTTHGTHGSVADDIRFDPDLARFRIPQEHIQNVTLLVKGGYGVVFRATCNGIDVAMKQLLPSKAKDQSAIAEFMNEIRLCARLDHPKIVKFVGISWSTLHDLAVLSEFMAHGDVTDLLKAERKKHAKDRVFKWHKTSAFATSKTAVGADVADALTFLHSFEPTIIHRDLKSKNVLMSANWEAKLSDFGISRVTSQDDTMTSNIGTVAWIAPEVLTGGRYSEKADIYSFGVFLSELDTLESPYAEMSERNAGGFSNARIAMMVSEGALQPSFTDAIPHPILELARKCLAFHDRDRPSAKQVAAALRSLL
ncbi:Aste57867_22236 [Aphanomyces stellatus]|uniref:Aste57867_22236 protein n=1 Tax=Aphanomyces stellatus TaxID=120398 RepID=A0A485LKZ4_9STRA|nr:hypothetical protein As57867_022167 [Aphanomyces stellatus]VFT98903.1 Aste57867_22236 [Aphanomyces stellatus]